MQSFQYPGTGWRCDWWVLTRNMWKYKIIICESIIIIKYYNHSKMFNIKLSLLSKASFISSIQESVLSKSFSQTQAQISGKIILFWILILFSIGNFNWFCGKTQNIFALFLAIWNRYKRFLQLSELNPLTRVLPPLCQMAFNIIPHHGKNDANGTRGGNGERVNWLRLYLPWIINNYSILRNPVFCVDSNIINDSSDETSTTALTWHSIL